MRAIGGVADRSPLLFLQVLETHHVSKERIALIVRMLPLSSVDNETERRRMVRERIVRIRAVTDRSVTTVRDAALTALLALQQELQ
jgi:hypothetical protein